MVSGIVHIFIRLALRDWSGAADFANYGGGATGALTTIGRLIIFSIKLKIG